MHPEYRKELIRLEYTLEYLRQYNDIVKEQKKITDSEVEYSISHYNSDNAEQFNELIINTARQGNINKKLRDINKSLSKPYFARVDFLSNESTDTGKYYIGKMSLHKEDTDELLIIDWRAPVSNLYYEGRIGEANYSCVDGEIKGEITLKRQYFIEQGKLENIMDIDITTNDEFLQAALGASKDNRLKDIVTTIQAEQNKVIRANMWNPLIVQGAAGGGKTTIALHRIAYLMYNNENILKPNNFMIIAPNRFFLSYISDVLPELGVEDVTQTTFEEFAFEVIGEIFNIISPHEKLSTIINNYSIGIDKEARKIERLSTFKSSLRFTNLLLRYLKDIELNFIPKEDFRIYNFVLLSYEEIQKRFLKEFNYLPFHKRIDELRKTLINKVKNEKDKILRQVDDQYEDKLNEIRFSMKDCEERRNKIIAIIDERDNVIKKVKKGLTTAIKEYVTKIHRISSIDYYRDFINRIEEFDKEDLNENFIRYLKENTLGNMDKGNIEIEDLAPLMLIGISIYGLQEKIDIRHIIIDEAQDFSLFQLYVLKSIVKSGSFTILGDLCQGIYSYRGVSDWNQVSKYIFKDEEPYELCLEQSYRTTVEIMEVASGVIGTLKDSRLPKAKPVIRHGEQVKVFEKSSYLEIVEAIEERIIELKNTKYKSMAIICKTLDECKMLKNKFKREISIITGIEKEYAGGIVLIPAYLSKGLEFDVVILANVSKEIFQERELDVKLLYVAMTRPLHELYMYSLGQKTTILEKVLE